jgi:hypothetical protein
MTNEGGQHMPAKMYSGTLPGQHVVFLTNEPNRLIAIGVCDQAVKSNRPLIEIAFNQDQLKKFLTDFIQTYEEFFGEPFEPLTDSDDTQRV